MVVSAEPVGYNWRRQAVRLLIALALVFLPVALLNDAYLSNANSAVNLPENDDYIEEIRSASDSSLPTSMTGPSDTSVGPEVHDVCLTIGGSASPCNADLPRITAATHHFRAPPNRSHCFCALVFQSRNCLYARHRSPAPIFELTSDRGASGRIAAPFRPPIVTSTVQSRLQGGTAEHIVFECPPRRTVTARPQADLSAED